MKVGPLGDASQPSSIPTHADESVGFAINLATMPAL